MSQEEDETSSGETVSGSTGDSTNDDSSAHDSEYETATATSSDNDVDEEAQSNRSLQRNKAITSNIDAQLNSLNGRQPLSSSEDSDDSDGTDSGSTATDDTDEDEDPDEDEHEEDNIESSPPADHSAALIKHSSEEDDATGTGTGTGTDSSEETEHTDDDEEAEPQLKYQRLGGGVTEKVKSDLASCLKCHPRFLVLGMKSGIVYVLDPHGDIIKQYRPHKNAVNDISIDQNGDHVATCSQDGMVYISYHIHTLSILALNVLCDT